MVVLASSTVRRSLRLLFSHDANRLCSALTRTRDADTAAARTTGDAAGKGRLRP